MTHSCFRNRFFWISLTLGAIGVSHPIAETLRLPQLRDLSIYVGISSAPTPFVNPRRTIFLSLRCLPRGADASQAKEIKWPVPDLFPTERLVRTVRDRASVGDKLALYRPILVDEFCTKTTGLLRDKTSCHGPVQRAEVIARRLHSDQELSVSVECNH